MDTTFDSSRLGSEDAHSPFTSSDRLTPAERERAFSIAIEDSLVAYFDVLIDFDPAFKLLLEAGEKLKRHELRLRAVVDVSGDFEHSGEEDGTDAATEKVVRAFREAGKLQHSYRRPGRTPASKARAKVKLVQALLGLQIHPIQLRELSREVWSKAADAGVQYRKRAMQLRRAWQKHEGAKTAMVQAHLYLVGPVARRYAGAGVDLGDLVQEGAVGLMRAVERWDHRRGIRFATYAHWWIRQAFTRSLADHSRTVRLPVNVNEYLFRLREIGSELSQKLSRDPTIEELAAAINLPVEKVTRLLESQRAAVSLDQPIGEDGETSLLEIVADDDAEDPSGHNDEVELHDLIEKELATLDEKEQKVLRRRFGMDNDQTETLEEIGARLGVSRERVRQIEARALRTLRKHASVAGLQAFLT